jgi:hypothetical protein
LFSSAARSERCSNPYPLDFVERDLVAGAVVKLGRPRTCATAVPDRSKTAISAGTYRPKSPSITRGTGGPGDRGFESISLQRRVTCEPDFLEQIIHYRLQSLSAFCKGLLRSRETKRLDTSVLGCVAEGILVFEMGQSGP